jgi:hypothetical protein
MATDGPTPPSCNREVFAHGTCVFVTSTIPSNAMEGWVQKIAELSGERVDWHFAAGRARVLALGDLEKVRAAILLLHAEHDRLYREACERLGFTDVTPPWGMQ